MIKNVWYSVAFVSHVVPIGHFFNALTSEHQSHPKFPGIPSTLSAVEFQHIWNLMNHRRSVKRVTFTAHTEKIKKKIKYFYPLIIKRYLSHESNVLLNQKLSKSIMWQSDKRFQVLVDYPLFLGQRLCVSFVAVISLHITKYSWLNNFKQTMRV